MWFSTSRNTNKPGGGLFESGDLFVKITFTGGGFFESGGLIDHLPYESLIAFIKL